MLINDEKNTSNWFSLADRTLLKQSFHVVVVKQFKADDRSARLQVESSAKVRSV